jgi:hypothetical protein
MPRVSIGNTNVGLFNPLSSLIGGLGGTYPMSYIRDLTWPTQTTPANVGDYAQAAGQFLFQLQVRTNNGARGTASITFPYGLTSTGSYVGGGRQVYSFTYSYINISATQTYPFTFQYWQVDGGGIYSYSNPLNVFVGDSAIVNNWNLIAVFA